MLNFIQAKNEKLMEEKSTMLVKQADMLQLGADSSGRMYALQQEVHDRTAHCHPYLVPSELDAEFKKSCVSSRLYVTFIFRLLYLLDLSVCLFFVFVIACRCLSNDCIRPQK